MGATITLYKSTDLGFDLDTKRPLFQSAEEADAYMSGRASKTWRSSNWNRIGDPMIAPLSFSDAAGYDIGIIILDVVQNEPDGTHYWFRVRDVSVNETNRTVIDYDIDFLATFGYHMAAGHLDRVPKGHRFALAKPVAPRHWKYTKSKALSTSLRVVFITTQARSQTSGGYNIQGPVYHVLEGVWSYLGQDGRIHGVNLIAEAAATGHFAISDVVNAWLVPAVGTMNDGNLAYWDSGGTTTHITSWKWTNSTGLACWITHARFDASDIPAELRSADVQGGIFQTTDSAAGRIMGVSDERGSIIWSFPDRKAYKCSDIEFSFKMSMASCEVDISFTEVLQLGDLVAHLQNDMFTYSCRPIDVIGDSWQDYLFRQRDADIANRKMQNQANLAGGVSNAATGALMGAAMGSVVPGIGTAAGAIAGAATSIVSGVAGYGVQSYYGDRMQRVTDEAYKVAQDTVAVNGMITSSAMAIGEVLYLFRIDADANSMSLIEASNGLEGVPADACTGNVFQEIADACNFDEFLPFGGTCEVERAIPSAWKKAISAQLSAGARFKLFGTWT